MPQVKHQFCQESDRASKRARLFSYLCSCGDVGLEIFTTRTRRGLNNNQKKEVDVKLLLRRDQKSGKLGMGKVSFLLDVRAELTPDETANVKKYKLGQTMLYERDKLVDRGSGLLGAASRLAFRMTNVSVSVNDLANGKQVECKDIVEMLAVEEQIKEAAHTFMAVLQAASTFGGEELVEIA